MMGVMVRHLAASTVLLAMAGGMSLPAASPSPRQSCPPAASLTTGLTLPMSAVRFLADDALGGRLAGSAEEQCAGDYIAEEFKRLGLRPAGENGTYFQAVSLASTLNPHASGGTGRNVIGVLDGADPKLASEFVVIGAHYDHLGEGTASSLAPGERAIHNGADDNASGVAAMLRAAEQLAAGPRPARSVTFIAFTGEESGLLGSAHYVASPTVAGPMVAMINLDMVGRLGDGPLIVYGVGTADEWTTIVEPAAKNAGVAITTRPEGYGASDHTSFYLKDIPVLHLFTNTHGEYHKPGDDWQLIDVDGLAKVASIVHDVARSVANRASGLTLKRGAGQPLQPTSASGGTGAYLGSVPDFTPVARGVKLSGVTAGSPGDKAGIRAGDIIIGIGAHDVADLQGMTDALRACKPGDEVDVRVIRGTDTLTLRVTLGSRASR